MYIRPLLVLVAILAGAGATFGCTSSKGAADGLGSPQRGSMASPAARASQEGEVDIENRIREVRAIRDAAEDALAALKQDEALREDARLAVPTPFIRSYFEDKLDEHASRHGLSVSDFVLAPMTVSRLDFPEVLEPSAPYPMRAKDAILAVPLQFSLQPNDKPRIEAFVRSLPELGLLFLPTAVERRGNQAKVEGEAFTFRQVDPVPTWTVRLPDREAWLREMGGGEALARSWQELEEETLQANEALAALSRTRFAQVRAEAWLNRWAAAKEQAAAVEVP